MINTFNIHDAIVISHDDPNEKGGIVIQIMPELKDVKISDLPIASPFFSCNSEHTMSNDMPEIDSIIRVLVDEHWKRFYYLGNTIFQNIFDFNTIVTKLGDASEISSTTYADLQFRLYEDGFLEFHNNNTGEHGTIHDSGSYSVYDSSGNIFINGAGNKLKLYNTANTLKEIMEDFQSILKNLVTPFAFKDSKGGPCTYADVGTDLPKINTALTKLNNLLED